MALVELCNARAGYNGRDVLRDVTVNIAEGERVALVGESGAGKSTLLRLIHHHCPAEAALVPFPLGLVNTLSVFHNVYMGRLHRNSTWRNLCTLARPAAADVRAVREVLAALRLEDEMFTTAGELSGGQQQRTAVGRALYQGCDVLLGDEPVSAVDQRQGREILQSINARNRTVILAMHDRELALAHTDRVIGLRNGAIVFDRPTAGLTPADLDPVYTG
jgi:phosphonate transport system ATP-binding protein